MRQGGEAVKRFALKLALFFLFGALINVAVAWGFALRWPLWKITGKSGYTSFVAPRWLAIHTRNRTSDAILLRPIWEPAAPPNVNQEFELPEWSVGRSPPSSAQRAPYLSSIDAAV